MRLTTRVTVVLLLVLFFQTQPSTPAQTKTSQTKSTASVSGKVSIKGKGISGIAVGVSRTELSSPFETLPRAITDEDGNYRITNLSAGSYRVAVATGAYVIDEPVNPMNRTLIVAEGETIEGINFSLVRGGVITGKITDDENRPIIQQQVQLFRADAFISRANQPQQPIFPSNTVTTDDRGIYRFFALPAGRYKVASGRAENTYSGSANASRVFYKQVFFPNTSDQVEASIIEVTENSEAKDINLTLGRPMQTFSVSGRVVNAESNNSGVAAIRFGVQRNIGNRFELSNAITITNSLGDFTIDALMPGSYDVFLLPDPGNEMRLESRPFNISDQNVEGLLLHLTRGAVVTGIVTLESEDQKAFTKLSKMHLYGSVMSSNGQSGVGRSVSATINADGSFRMGGLASGILNLGLGGAQAFGQPRSFDLLRIERDGIVQPKGIEIREGDQISNIRVVVAYGTAVVQGVVNIQNGTLPSGFSAFVRISKIGEAGHGIATPQLDARRHFRIEGLTTGTYELSVLVTGPPQAGSKPRPPIKQQVILQEGTVTDVVLTLDLATTP